MNKSSHKNKEVAAMEYFSRSSFGQLLISLFAGYFTSPSLQSFLILAQGWSLSSSQHTITTYLRLSGAVKFKHFSRFYAFFSSPFYKVTDQLWEKLILLSASFFDTDELIRIQVDDGTRKKNGRQVEGASYYRNGAGSARQEYRSLWGLNWVWVTMSIPLKRWPTHFLTIPVGLKLYMKEPIAKALGQPYKSRSQLAREMVGLIADTLVDRPIMVSADGGYSTKEFLRKLPENVKVTGRFPISSNLYQLPAPKAKGTRGPKPKKGPLIGCAKTMASKKKGWIAHPTEANTYIQAWKGIWHSVLPGVVITVVVVKRDKAAGDKKEIEAFFSTDLSLSMDEILDEYRQRWAVEINIRDANAYFGFGGDQCQSYRCIVGVNTFRALLAACRSVWFLQRLEKNDAINLLNGRPWYRKKTHPTQLDAYWMFKEALACEGITPTPAFLDGVPINKANSLSSTQQVA
jgi:hypothetical protein